MTLWQHLLGPSEIKQCREVPQLPCPHASTQSYNAVSEQALLMRAPRPLRRELWSPIPSISW